MYVEWHNFYVHVFLRVINDQCFTTGPYLCHISVPLHTPYPHHISTYNVMQSA